MNLINLYSILTISHFDMSIDIMMSHYLLDFITVKAYNIMKSIN